MKNSIKDIFSKNIINYHDWDDNKKFSYYLDRYEAMRLARQDIEKEWKNAEEQINAISFVDSEGAFHVQLPLEKILKEIYMWRTNWKIQFDIIPDGQWNIDDLQASKYILNYHLDWNFLYNFWKENKKFREWKCDFWTWIFYTWIREYKDTRYEIKESIDINNIDNITDITNLKNCNKIENSTWLFFPKAIHPLDFYIDEKACHQSDLQQAEDVIWREAISVYDFIIRYWNEKNENIKNKISSLNDNDKIILYHYINAKTKIFLTVVNNDFIIKDTILLNQDWKIPFTLAQHYTGKDRIWGEWIPKRIDYIKWTQSELWTNILQGASMANWIHLLTWNDDQIGQDWSIGWWWINILRTTWGIEWTKKLDTEINLWFFSTILWMLDDRIVQDTWDNPRAPYQAQTDKVWIMEMMEANKASRLSQIDENYNICLDESLTMMLDRLKQYAPALLKTEIKNNKWEVIWIKFPNIRINWYTVKQEKGKYIFTENLWKYGYFEMKPDLIQWLWVKIITSSTSSIMPILERKKLNEYIANITNILSLAQANPKILEEVNNTMDIKWLIWWMNDAYWYDSNNKLKAQTEKDKEQQKALETFEKASKFLNDNLKQNEESISESMWNMAVNNKDSLQNQDLWSIIWWNEQGNNIAEGTIL